MRATITTEIEVELADFDTADLEAELERRRKGAPYGDAELSEALAELIIGDVPDCLLHIERALPMRFRGFAEAVARYYAKGTA
jgi:hypothetical protein